MQSMNYSFKFPLSKRIEATPSSTNPVSHSSASKRSYVWIKAFQNASLSHNYIPWLCNDPASLTFKYIFCRWYKVLGTCSYQCVFYLNLTEFMLLTVTNVFGGSTGFHDLHTKCISVSVELTMRRCFAKGYRIKRSTSLTLSPKAVL